jgi:outer membrane protein OmpA-like peptidoglycan-associated protein
MPQSTLSCISTARRSSSANRAPASIAPHRGVPTSERGRKRSIEPGKVLRPPCALIAFGLALLLLPGISRSAEPDCRFLVDDFNQAVDGGLDTEAQVLIDRIATSAGCGSYQVPAQRRLAALRLNVAQALMARGRPSDEYDHLLTTAELPEVLWQASATLGEVRFGERRFAEAARAYDRAIEIIKNESRTPVAPSRFEIEGLIERAAQARLLSANGLATNGSAQFVQAARDQRDGSVGGFYSGSVRGILPRAIPVPITFEYRKADLTGVGEQAARELVDVLKQQQPARVVLVGHTDIRGTAEFNMRLSRERAETIAAFLRQNGLDVAIDTVGKGAAEPVHLSDTSGLTQEDIYALDRRVEWQRQ